MEPEQLQEMFHSKDLFAKLLGIEVTEIGQGFARARLKIKDEHKNAMNIAHGGAIFTLADMAFAAASNSRHAPAVAINCNISFLKSVKKGTLTAEAKENFCGTRLASYTIEILDEEEEVCAVFQGMVYRKVQSSKNDM